jgi:hypothetical protein
MLEFDEVNLERTAKIVLATNPHAADRWDLTSLIFNMRAVAAAQSTANLGFVSTAGYMLTFFKSRDKIGVRASVTDYNIEQYLKSKGVAL